jgi:hypothetical protein
VHGFLHGQDDGQDDGIDVASSDLSSKDVQFVTALAAVGCKRAVRIDLIEGVESVNAACDPTYPESDRK